MNLKWVKTRQENDRRTEQNLIALALETDATLRHQRNQAPSGTPISWTCEISPAEVERGREYERAAIAEAEREAARRKA